MTSPQQLYVNIIDWLFAGEKQKLYCSYLELKSHSCSKRHRPLSLGGRGIRAILWALRCSSLQHFSPSPSLNILTGNAKSTTPIAVPSQEYLKVFLSMVFLSLTGILFLNCFISPCLINYEDFFERRSWLIFPSGPNSLHCAVHATCTHTHTHTHRHSTNVKWQ